MNFEDYFYYDETSPTFLRWRVERRTGKYQQTLIVGIGDPAGGKFSGGYYGVNLEGLNHRAHRIVWQLHNGKIEKSQLIDHINRDKSDNRIDNLRLCDDKVNSRNRGVSSKNISGITGVCLSIDKRRQISSWCAYFHDLTGKQINKSFAILKYGYDQAFEMACAWRKAMIEELNLQGAGYTENHGFRESHY